MADVHLVTPKCTNDTKYSPPCSSASLNGTEPRSLFVLVAHVPDDRNAALFRASLRSIRCHHPRDAILIVDNDSPAPGVVGILNGRDVSPRQEGAEGGTHGPVRLSRRAPSLGVLSAWAAADEALQLPQLYGLSE